MQEKPIRAELLKMVSRLCVAAKDVLIAWMVLMSLWGLFSAYWTYHAIKQSKLELDYMTGTFTVINELKK